MKSYKEKETTVFDFSDEWNRTHNKSKLVEQYKTFLDGKVGEFGCNTGYHCFLMAEFDNIDSIVAIDVNAEAIDFGNTHNRKKFSIDIGKKVTFMESDLRNINLEDEIFDAIVSFHTIEHIYKTHINAVIQEKYRLLKKGGYALVSLPYLNHFHDPNHVCLYTEHDLEQLFVKNNFRTVECYLDRSLGNGKHCIHALFQK